VYIAQLKDLNCVSLNGLRSTFSVKEIEKVTGTKNLFGHHAFPLGIIEYVRFIAIIYVKITGHN